jgi:WhiB family redox-sensing transcriptional regulator
MTTSNAAATVLSLSEARAQQQAARWLQAVDELDREYPAVAEMPSFPASAPCKAPGVDPRLWDAASVDDAPLSVARESFLRITARTLCAGCPALDACLAWALAVDEPEGIWGGTTPAERLEIRTRESALAA